MQDELKLDPHSGVTVIFRSKRGDRLKILVWDGSGLVLICKGLEQGSFAWPKIQGGLCVSRGRNTRRCSRAWNVVGWGRSGWCRLLRQDDSGGPF